MILVDANLLIYAHNQSSAQYPRARAWLESELAGPGPVGVAWTSLLALVRISTSARAFPMPFSPEEAATVIDRLLDHASLTILQPGSRHWLILRRLPVGSQARGPLAVDAHLAALALEHGATMYTTDRDFSRFADLRVVNPLEDVA
ncbi:MAG TPA: TA system VapC family ribonuclease toxin [Chloroflexota bacterium]|nr:TA system VapC family ribonuclease toxin [Chloroflexota bacterium]